MTDSMEDKPRQRLMQDLMEWRDSQVVEWGSNSYGVEMLNRAIAALSSCPPVDRNAVIEALSRLKAAGEHDMLDDIVELLEGALCGRILAVPESAPNSAEDQDFSIFAEANALTEQAVSAPSESQTPRTDTFHAQWDSYNYPMEAIDFARQLERTARSTILMEIAHCEPPIDTVIRHLCRASDAAQKRRVVVGVREAIGFALTQAFREQFRTSHRKRK